MNKSAAKPIAIVGFVILAIAAYYYISSRPLNGQSTSSSFSDSMATMLASVEGNANRFLAEERAQEGARKAGNIAWVGIAVLALGVYAHFYGKDEKRA